MYKTVLIVALCLMGIFIHPFDPGLMDFIYRFVIFSIIVYLVYDFYRQSKQTPVEEPTPEPIRTVIKNDELVKIGGDWCFADLIEGDAKTREFLEDQFEILASLIFPDNGWVFYKEKGQIVKIHQKTFIDHHVIDREDRYPLSGLMQILDEKNDIIIENNIDKTGNLLPFYTESDYSAASFIGIPLSLERDEKLFLIFDSHHTEHFNQDEKKIFSRIASNSTTWILNRIKAYSLLTDIKEQSNLLSFAKNLNSSKTISTAIEKFAVLISEEFEASRLTVSVCKKDQNTAVIKKVIGQKDEYEENAEFPLDEGLTGWVISKSKPYLVEDLEKGEYFIPRYTKTEKTNFGLRSFLGVPIIIEDQVLGAVTLEHRLPKKYLIKDQEKIIRFVDILSTTFSRTSTPVTS